ncbi:MAG: PQQ-binding-like beta-propeller repeat protein [Polyangiaceae bacterium]|jgi:outer membrane protein assembly factor BamB
MRFEIVIAPEPVETCVDDRAVAASVLDGTRPSARRRVGAELLDVLIDGANVTARLHETHVACVLRDLASALAALAGGARGKAIVPFYDEPWELCIERFGSTACLSIYRTGPDPRVAVYDRAIPFVDVNRGVTDAIARFLARRRCNPRSRSELVAAAEQMEELGEHRWLVPDGAPDVPVLVPVVVELEHDAPLSFGAEFAMRPSEGTLERAEVERTDLHALLFRGRFRAEVRGRVVELGECHPLLVAERLLDLSRRAFDAWERGLALNARGDAAGVRIGIRVSPEGELALSLGPVDRTPSQAPAPGKARVLSLGERRSVHTFPAFDVADVLDASTSFGRALVRAVLRRDRSQASNLRLAVLRRALRDAADALRAAHQTDSKVNPAPEPYRRAFATLVDVGKAGGPHVLEPTRLRYAARWRAIVPGIDLRSTYLCGDRLVVGSTSEMWALDRMTGSVLWRTDVARGSSIVTQSGIARIALDGSLAVHDLASGDVTVRSRIAPRSHGSMAGAVVHGSGMPKLLIVTEGEHHLVAIDLTSGEPRWRWSWNAARGRFRGIPRMKRAGRLLYFTCGDGALTALDVSTGAVVWRLRDRLRFRTPPAITRDALYAVAGGARGAARLYGIDPYSGSVRWSTAVGEANSPCSLEAAPLASDASVAVAVRRRSGVALAAFRRSDGAPLPERGQVFTPSGTSWLAVDDAFIGNTPTGELVAIDADTGGLRWRHVLGPRPLESDVPRRLEPVLRCGALFVPHTDVVIVRPRDGGTLGCVGPTDAVPDLLRVDERCDVYVAEESGHVVAFGAIARLSLVERPCPERRPR